MSTAATATEQPKATADGGGNVVWFNDPEFFEDEPPWFDDSDWCEGLPEHPRETAIAHDFRMVAITSGFLQLAGASDANAIGAKEPHSDQ